MQLCCNKDLSPIWLCSVEIMTGTTSRILDRDPSALCVIPTSLERTIWVLFNSLLHSLLIAPQFSFNKEIKIPFNLVREERTSYLQKKRKHHSVCRVPMTTRSTIIYSCGASLFPVLLRFGAGSNALR